MILLDILQIKGTTVYTTNSAAMLAEVVESLVEHNCGSLVVCDASDPDRMVGIVTERDILRAVSAGHDPLDETTVAKVMSSEVITGVPTDSVADAMGTMTKNRIRHLPIIEDDRLVGIISIGDVVKAQHKELSAENHHLKNYIQG